MANRTQVQTGMPLVIAGHSIWVTHESVPISSIKLNPENPRIRILVEREFGGKKPTAQELQGLIKKQPAYDELQKSIRKAGGIFEPVMVGHDGLVVEGNTRMTVFSVLHAGNPDDPRWKSIPITRLPKDVPPRVLEVLMASYHVAGKTKWRAYAQADSIFRQHRVVELVDVGIVPQGLCQLLLHLCRAPRHGRGNRICDPRVLRIEQNFIEGKILPAHLYFDAGEYDLVDLLDNNMRRRPGAS